MGTRIDFWIGIDKDAEWIGSIGWDGHVEDVPEPVAEASDPEDFRHHVLQHIRANQGINVSDGWQWPWQDSRTSDNSVWFANGIVYFEADDWLVPMSQLQKWNEASQNDDDDAASPSKMPGAVMPDWDAMPDMLLSPRALYHRDRSKRGRDTGAGPLIITARS